MLLAAQNKDHLDYYRKTNCKMIGTKKEVIQV